MIKCTEPVIIVIVGASGDLTRRKLLPALHSLMCEDLLDPRSRIVGLARSELTAEAFHLQLYEGVASYARLKPGMCERWPQFAQRISYVSGEYDAHDTYERLAAHLAQRDHELGAVGNILFYLAIPPQIYPTVISQIGAAGLNQRPQGWTRIIIEKPFGHDLATAKTQHPGPSSVFDEQQLYRHRHFRQETVQNILMSRFGNGFLSLYCCGNRNYGDLVQTHHG